MEMHRLNSLDTPPASPVAGFKGKNAPEERWEEVSLDSPAVGRALEQTAEAWNTVRGWRLESSPGIAAEEPEIWSGGWKGWSQQLDRLDYIAFTGKPMPPQEELERAFGAFMAHALKYHADFTSSSTIPQVDGQLLYIAHKLKAGESSESMAAAMRSLAKIGGLEVDDDGLLEAKIRHEGIEDLFAASESVMLALREVRSLRGVVAFKIDKMRAAVESLVQAANRLEKGIRAFAGQEIRDTGGPRRDPMAPARSTNLAKAAVQSLKGAASLLWAGWNALGTEETETGK